MLPLGISRTTKVFLIVTCFFSLVLASFSAVVRAAETSIVTSTVTVQNISVTITTSGTVDFATINTGITEDTTTNGVDDTETVENNGNISEDFNIKAADSLNWILADTAGDETFTMKSCITNCDASPVWTSVGIDPLYATLATGVAATGTQDFDLQVGAPITTINYTEQTIIVTIQAVIAS